VGDRWPPTVDLRFEHLIPRHIPSKQLIKRPPRSLRALEQFLNAYFRAAVLTIEDDRQLNVAGLRSRMPSGWTLGDDPWARYHEAKLKPDRFRVPATRFRYETGARGQAGRTSAARP
jgi:hypothetical protein